MPPEQFQPTPPIPTLEELKETYKQKLDGILNSNLTVENIDTFADDACKDLISLIDEVRKEYNRNEVLEPNPHLNSREQEDDAFNKLELFDIQDTLQRIIEVQNKIDALKKYAQENIDITNTIIIPPQEGHFNIINGSGGGIEVKKLIPRLITLLYILEADFDISTEDITVTRGGVTKEMMRKTPYVRVEIPDMGRVVYICDEEDNASYVFDTNKLQEANIIIKDTDISNKGKMKEIIDQHPGIGKKIIQSKHWRINMSESLSLPIPEKALKEDSDTEEPKKTISEFAKKERQEFLDFSAFQAEVRNLYPSNIEGWYQEERQKHPDWPSKPDVNYKDTGWVDWSRLVGKNKPKKKEITPFDVFQSEVRNLYPGDVQEWYKKERSKHTDWPARPDSTYKNTDWKGWSELVGKENILKKEYLPFDAFQSEVRDLYQSGGDVQRWYYKERLTHSNWPSHPPKKYKKTGWVDWSELVGKENIFKKEYLPFNTFQSEVRVLYSGEDNVKEWYLKEKLNHPDWPARPDRTYKDAGWVNWPELVGKNK